METDNNEFYVVGSIVYRGTEVVQEFSYHKYAVQCAERLNEIHK